MYKVFFNQKSITISAQENITLNKKNIQKADAFSVFEIQNWFKDFIRKNVKEVELIHASPSDFFEIFKSVFVKIDAAGGVVLNRDRKILFIFRNGVWDLPKGKVNKGEKVNETAIREVEEECGIRDLQIVKELPSTYHIYQSPYKKTKGQWIFKQTFWFEMEYCGKESGIPQYEEGITKVKWFTCNELDEVFLNTYENLKQIINLYRV